MRAVSNLNRFPVKLLDLVSLKDATIQIRHLSKQPLLPLYSVRTLVLQTPSKKSGQRKLV